MGRARRDGMGGSGIGYWVFRVGCGRGGRILEIVMVLTSIWMDGWMDGWMIPPLLSSFFILHSSFFFSLRVCTEPNIERHKIVTAYPDAVQHSRLFPVFNLESTA